MYTSQLLLYYVLLITLVYLVHCVQRKAVLIDAGPVTPPAGSAGAYLDLRRTHSFFEIHVGLNATMAATIKSVLVDETVSLVTSSADVVRSGAYIYPFKVPRRLLGLLLAPLRTSTKTKTDRESST